MDGVTASSTADIAAAPSDRVNVAATDSQEKVYHHVHAVSEQQQKWGSIHNSLVSLVLHQN